MRNIIKKIILKLILIIGKFCSFVYSYKTSQYLRTFKVYIYSAYISKEFNHVRKGTIIPYLSSLSGVKIFQLEITVLLVKCLKSMHGLNMKMIFLTQ